MELASISDSWCTLGKTLKGRGRIWKQKRCKPYSNTELSFWSPQIRISVIERMVSTSRFRFCSVTVVFLVKTWYRYLEEREETKAYTKWVESQAQGPLSTLSTAAVFKFLLAQFPIQDGDRSPHTRKMAGALKYYMPGTHLPKLRQEHCQALNPAPENFRVHENHRVDKIRGSWGALGDSDLELKACLTVRSDGRTVIIVSATYLTQDSHQG